MKFIKICVVLYLTLLSIGCQKSTINQSNTCTIIEYPDHIKATKFQSMIDKYTAQGLPGISLLIRDSNGTWAGASGYADIKNNILMQPCHVSKVASLTKMFMGALTFKLEEEGALKIGEPITKYLSANDIKGIENADKVTIRQLMNHTTGIYDVIEDKDFYLDVLNNPPKHRTQADLLKFVRGKAAAFLPGTRSGYSNTNTLLLSMVIEKATGKKHETLLHEKIIDPLQLKNTYYFYHDALPAGQVAQGYYDLYNNGQLENLSSYNTGSGNGYTGIYSNTYDLLTFIDALLIQKSLISQASLDKMLLFNQDMEDSSDRYLGPGIMKDFVSLTATGFYGLGHRGRDLAYSADLFYFPEKNQVMALIVNYGTDGESLLRPVFYDLRKEIVATMAE